MSILVAVVSGFASGVFICSLFVFGWPLIIFIIIIATLLGAMAFLKPRLVYSLGAVFLFFVVFGMLRTALTNTQLPETFVRDVKHRVSYDGIVVADPDVRDSNQRVKIRVSRGEETTNMLVIAGRYPSVSVGDTVHVSGTLEIPQSFTGDNGRVFRYDKYLERDGVQFVLNFAYLRTVREAPWYSIGATLAKVKHSFLNGISATLPEPHASLAGGVVIGGKSGLGNELKDDFTRSGLIQIIVLSGYNVMIVAEWLMEALALMKLSRRLSALAGSLTVLIFVGIAGASATALRAMLMAFIALYARATGKSYTAGRALLLVVFLMLVWNPLYLVYDPGFGLSVVATAGLIWLAPIIERMMGFVSQSSDGGLTKQKHGFWKNAIATTLAAQIAVLPLLLYNTGNLSLIAIPANLLVMPVVPLAMGLSALAGFAGMFFSSFAPILGIMLALPAYLSNAYLLFIARESASLPFASFTLHLFPFWLTVVTYAGLIYFIASKRSSTTRQFRFAKNASI